MNRFKSSQPDLQGSFLVASPQLENSAFERTVVFVLQDDENGTFGVALNRLADDESWESFKEVSGTTTGQETAISGGPLGGPVFAIHCSASLGELEMPGGIFLSSQAETLQELMQQMDEPYRIVLGVVGWETGEVHSEVADGLWIPMSATADEVFGEIEWMWEKCMLRFGRERFAQTVGIRELVDDPTLN